MAIKQSRGITIGKGTPQRLEGQNGDMTIRSSRRGLKLYVKESNKWHSLDLGIDLRQIASTVRKLEDEVKRLSTKTNNTPVVDKILLRQPGGASAVGIQNKSGNIAFRNSTDTGEAKVQAIPFDVGTNNTAGRGWGQIYYNSANTSHELESNGLNINAATNAPDATEQALIQLTPKTSNSAIRFNSSDGSITTGKFIIGYDRLKADNSTSDARFKIHTGSLFADDSIFNLDANGVNLQGAISYKHNTHSAAGPTDNVDVAGISVLKVNTISNNVVIGGFTGGIEGQILHIVKTSTNNFLQLEHTEGGGSQDIYLTTGVDERVVGYGGYTLYCNGSHWFSLSNPTGAADAG